MGMIDSSVVRVAELRNDLITTAQLHELGLDNHTIKRRVAAGRLVRVRRGLFTTRSLPLTTEQRSVAACLAAPDGVLSHTTAAASHGLRGIPTRWLEITVPHGRKPDLAGVRIHRSNRMPAGHVVDLPNGARITTVARTLFDLADVVDGRALRSAVEDALNRGLVTMTELTEMATSMCGRGRPGSFVFGGLVDRRPADQPAVQSEGELQLADALTERGIAIARQHPLTLPSGRPIRADLAVPSARLSIEVDDPTWHATPEALQRDHSRDLELALLGWERVRFTTDDVVCRVRTCVAAVEALVGRRPDPLPPRRAA
jgi:very-short-patch-repair endonuclease